jgi:hypothetical protein
MIPGFVRDSKLTLIEHNLGHGFSSNNVFFELFKLKLTLIELNLGHGVSLNNV